MKRITLIFFLFFLMSISFGQIIHTFQKTYGCLGYNYGRCSYQTGDGGYIILGNKTGFSGGTDIYLVKTDTVGKIIWDKAIGGTEIDWANDFKITHDKGYIITGYTNALFGNGYDVLLVKTDSMGVVQWSKVYGGTDWDMGNSVIEDKDHNYLVAGESYSNSFGDADVYIIKTDSIGDTLWTKHYGGTGTDIAYSIDTTYTSGYVVAGVTRKLTDTTYDAYLLSIKKNGDTLFTKKYGDSLDDKFYCARQVDDSSFIICGYTENYGALQKDGWIIKMDTLGDTTGTKGWIQIFSFSNIGNEEYYDIKRSWTNGFITIGYTTTWGNGGSDVYPVLTDNGGWFVYGPSCGGSRYDIGYSVNLTKDSCYIYTGTTESYGFGLSNIYFIKTDKTGYCAGPPTHEVGINESENVSSIKINIYPNPTKDIANIIIGETSDKKINITLYNVLGEILFQDNFNCNKNLSNYKIDLSSYPDGIYFVQLRSSLFTTTSKVVKQTKD